MIQGVHQFSFHFVFCDFLNFLSTLIKNTLFFLDAHSVLCWKMTKIFEFELILKKLRRKT